MTCRPPTNDVIIAFTYIYKHLFIYLFIGYLKILSIAQAIDLYHRTVGLLTIVQDVERSAPGFFQNTILAFAKG
jgi:hypothetical protein